MRKKWFAALCALLLLCACTLGLLGPASASSRRTTYFTAVNDTVMELRDETMPFSSGGEIYVPYTLFDPNTTGIQLGVYASFGSNTAVFYGRTSGALIFDLSQDTATSSTGDKFSKRAIRHNSTVFVPVDLVVDYFNLNWSILVYPDCGMIVRVKNSSAQISDASFITVGNHILESRYNAYLKGAGLLSTPEPSPSPTPTSSPSSPLPPYRPPVTSEPPTESPSQEDPSPSESEPQQPEGGDVYVAVKCTSGGDTAALAAALDDRGSRGVFFFPVEELALRDGEIRALAAGGHKVGLLLDTGTPDTQEAQARHGSELLSHILRAHTDIALTGDGSAVPEGWLDWPVTVDGTAGERSSALQTEDILRDAVRAEDTFLLLDDSAQTAGLVSGLLEQMEEAGCAFRLSLEPMLSALS